MQTCPCPWSRLGTDAVGSVCLSVSLQKANKNPVSNHQVMSRYVIYKYFTFGKGDLCICWVQVVLKGEHWKAHLLSSLTPHFFPWIQCWCDFFLLSPSRWQIRLFLYDLRSMFWHCVEEVFLSFGSCERGGWHSHLSTLLSIVLCEVNTDLAYQHRDVSWVSFSAIGQTQPIFCF